MIEEKGCSDCSKTRFIGRAGIPFCLTPSATEAMRQALAIQTTLGTGNKTKEEPVDNCDRLNDFDPNK